MQEYQSEYWRLYWKNTQTTSERCVEGVTDIAALDSRNSDTDIPQKETSTTLLPPRQILLHTLILASLNPK